MCTGLETQVRNGVKAGGLGRAVTLFHRENTWVGCLGGNLEYVCQNQPSQPCSGA